MIEPFIFIYILIALKFAVPTQMLIARKSVVSFVFYSLFN